jgi:hypothetical protein
MQLLYIRMSHWQMTAGFSNTSDRVRYETKPRLTANISNPTESVNMSSKLGQRARGVATVGVGPRLADSRLSDLLDWRGVVSVDNPVADFSPEMALSAEVPFVAFASEHRRTQGPIDCLRGLIDGLSAL